MSKWCRIVTYRYSLAPLSCAGSLRYIGDRFTAGTELDGNTLAAWPALYVAEDFETAIKEKVQHALDHSNNGLSPQDMALTSGASMSSVILHGSLTKVSDLTSVAALAPIVKVFGKDLDTVERGQAREKVEDSRWRCTFSQAGQASL